MDEPFKYLRKQRCQLEHKKIALYRMVQWSLAIVLCHELVENDQ